MQYKTIVLIDGENLVFRFQDMVSSGKTALTSVLHTEDCFIWVEDILTKTGSNDIVRVSYYTTVTGDETKIDDVKKKISEAGFSFKTGSGQDGSGTLVPHVFKKHKKSSKTKSVDINLTIDAFKYAHGTTIDKIIIMSGDGDYIPLLREVMSKGKMVQVYAFSSGLNKDILCNVDDLLILDEFFFESEDE